MKTKILISVVVVIVGFLGYVSTRESKFNYSVSGQINAPIDKVWPYVSDLKLGGEWSPFEKVDPKMKKEFVNGTNTVGSKLNFDGNAEAGSGSLEITNIVPNQSVDLNLIMTKPFPADHMINYRLVQVPGGTQFTWSMSGDGGFMGKLMSVFIDCEKMITDQFKKGISNLKTIVEAK